MRLVELYQSSQIPRWHRRLSQGLHHSTRQPRARDETEAGHHGAGASGGGARPAAKLMYQTTVADRGARLDGWDLPMPMKAARSAPGAVLSASHGALAEFEADWASAGAIPCGGRN